MSAWALHLVAAVRGAAPRAVRSTTGSKFAGPQPLAAWRRDLHRTAAVRGLRLSDAGQQSAPRSAAVRLAAGPVHGGLGAAQSRASMRAADRLLA